MENLKKTREIMPTADEVDNLSEFDAKQLLKKLLTRDEARRTKNKLSAQKCNRKRYASAKELQEIKEENEKIKTAISDIKAGEALKKLLISQSMSDSADSKHTIRGAMRSNSPKILTKAELANRRVSEFFREKTPPMRRIGQIPQSEKFIDYED